MNVLGNPVSVFLDSNGQPLQGGSIYIGQPNIDPTNPANQITVYQDQGLSIPLQQPIKTTNGQPSLNGQQIPVYLGTGVTTYALAALNAGGVVVMFQPNCAPFSLGGSASGNMTVKEYVAGTDYVVGTSTTLPLPGDPGSGANCFVDFDGVPQHYPDDFTLNSSRTQLVFSSPISAPNKVYLKFGTTQAVGTPAAGSVIDSSVSPNSKLYNRINDLIDVMDFGAAGNGATDDTTAMNNGINASPYNYYPNKTFKVAGAFTLPFNKQLIEMPGAAISPSGSGTATYNGPQIQFGYNPSNQGGWTVSTGNSYEGLGVDFGGYGPRSFSGLPNIVALNGAINVPASANGPQNAIGVSGYAKNSSTNVAGVGLYGQGDAEATNALVWGINTRAQDNGFATTVWGAEFDVNLTNVNSVAKGVDIVGGSTVEPAVSIGLRVGPLGTFSSPPKRWERGILIDDGSSINGIEIGAASLTTSGSMPLNFMYFNGSNARLTGGSIFSDSNGDMSFQAQSGSALAIFQAGTGKQIQVGGASGGIGFFNSTPKAQVTGWGTPTNGGVFNNFPGSAATLAQVGQVVAQLLLDLKGFGLYGA